MNNHNRMLKALLFASAIAASAAAQDTAYVPFVVTANTESASIEARQGDKVFLKEVAAGVEDTLHIILEGVPAFSRPGIAAPNPVTMHSSRGRLSLELSPQHYRNAEISLYSLGGKRVLHGKVNASDAARSISRSDIATGVYVLYIRGSGGGFSTRLSHQGGGMDIDVSFGGLGGVSPLRKEAAEFGAWEITVSAEGHIDTAYVLTPVEGQNPLQEITLREPILCGGEEYDPDTEFCLGNAVTPLCGGETFTAAQFCSGTDVLNKCGGKEYDPDTEFCLGSAIASLCGGKTFTGSQFCSGTDVLNKCGGDEYDPDTEFCLGNAVTPLCGGEEFTAAQFCSGTDVLNKCGGKEYDPDTEFCLGTAVTPLCGGKTFTSSQFCLGGAITPLCGGKTFTGSQFCLGGAITPLCGGETFTGSEFCLGSTVTPLCGGEEFTSSKFCSGNTVFSKCGGTVEYAPLTEQCCGSGKYAIATQFCHDGTAIHDKCGGEDYDPSTQYCHGGQISLCDKPHTSAEFCFDGTIYEKCGDDEYDPDAQFCHTDSNVYDKCGGEEYDPGVNLCDARDGKQYKYVAINTQTWMAENLNYAVSGSKCGDGSSLSDDNTASCDTYGRLYNWATATALDASCNTTTCSGQVQSKHQGVCPSGWHLPSDAEWTALTTFVGSNAETKLKAESGWNYYNGVPGNGSNQYGFSALPGGFGFPTIGTSSVSFQDVRNSGNWWSATEIDDSPAFFRLGANVDRDYGYIGFRLFSVRCVQD